MVSSVRWMKLKPVRLHARCVVCLVVGPNRVSDTRMAWHIVVGSDSRSAHGMTDNDNSTCTYC